MMVDSTLAAPCGLSASGAGGPTPQAAGTGSYPLERTSKGPGSNLEGVPLVGAGQGLAVFVGGILARLCTIRDEFFAEWATEAISNGGGTAFRACAVGLSEWRFF